MTSLECFLSCAGFRTFSEEDQYDIVRLGQSQSRILAAACHWYRRDKHDFDYFLSWKPSKAVREYKFKESCLKFSEMIAHQDWDMIESALMNSLVMIATGKFTLAPTGSRSPPITAALTNQSASHKM